MESNGEVIKFVEENLIASFETPSLLTNRIYSNLK
jgi:hypothetical protein